MVSHRTRTSRSASPWVSSAKAQRAIALCAAAVFGGTYLLLVCLRAGQLADYRVWELTLPLPEKVQTELDVGARQVMPFVALVILVIDSWVRRSKSTFVVGLAASALATSVAFALRHTLPRPNVGDIGIPANTYPSTHVALASAPLLAVILAVGLRAWAGRACAVLVVLVMIGNTMHFVHRPSDTVGAVALTVASVAALYALRLGPRRVG